MALPMEISIIVMLLFYQKKKNCEHTMWVFTPVSTSLTCISLLKTLVSFKIFNDILCMALSVKMYIYYKNFFFFYVTGLHLP